MQNYMFLFDEWWYILILLVVMVISGLVKQYNLFLPAYNYLIERVKNQKFLVALLSFIGGILPIPGRVIVSAGLLDTIAPNEPAKRSKFGIIDYLATHHYYLWSPLEKTILIPMAVLKLSYWGVLAYTWPLLLVSLLFLIGYIVSLDSNDITVRPITTSTSTETPRKKWFQFIDWKTLGLIFVIILLGNYIKQSGGSIKTYIESLAHGINFIWLSILAFGGAFVLGSSSKFAGMTALLTSIFGLPYFTYLFAIEFAGYLLSPFHKCVAIGMSYFKTPLKQYYKVIGVWSAILVITGIVSLLIRLVS